MSGLTREQVEILFAQIISYQHGAIAFKSAVEQCIAHELALRATITQQAQELERVKAGLAAMTQNRDEWKKQSELDRAGNIMAGVNKCTHSTYWITAYGNCMACRAEAAEQQLSAMTAELEEYRSIAEKIGAEKAVSQLAASQARCRELERGKPSDAIRDLLNSALREENEYGSWAQKEILDNFAQLQATLAAREAAYTEIERKFRDVCMAHGPALLEIHGLKKELITSQAQVTTLKEHINNLESTDHH